MNFNTITKDQVINMYLDYVNNFLTVEAFADHYGLLHWQANKVINLGRELLNNNKY